MRDVKNVSYANRINNCWVFVHLAVVFLTTKPVIHIAGHGALAMLQKRAPPSPRTAVYNCECDDE